MPASSIVDALQSMQCQHPCPQQSGPPGPAAVPRWLRSSASGWPGLWLWYLRYRWCPILLRIGIVLFHASGSQNISSPHMQLIGRCWKVAYVHKDACSADLMEVQMQMQGRKEGALHAMQMQLRLKEQMQVHVITLVLNGITFSLMAALSPLMRAKSGLAKLGLAWQYLISPLLAGKHVTPFFPPFFQHGYYEQWLSTIMIRGG